MILTKMGQDAVRRDNQMDKMKESVKIKAELEKAKREEAKEK